MNSLFEIERKVIVLTGATGVLGTAMAEALASAGATLGILGRNEFKTGELANKLQQRGFSAFPLVADVTDESSLQKAALLVKETHGSIDVLINAAGGNMAGATVGPDQHVLNLSAESIKKVMELNYLGTVLPTQAFLPLMLSKKSGSIINISSAAAQRPLTRVMGYASSKAAINNYTKWMAVELAQKSGNKLRVNAIAPGFFLTDQNRMLLTNPDGSLTTRGESILQHTPMARFGEPDDLIGTLIWLCSDASRFVTGVIIPVDGGFNAFSGV